MGFKKGNKIGETHGMRDTPTYNSWYNMKSRCSNKNSDVWVNYGGRGISYTSDWETFERFLSDMGERPKGKTLDRIDNNGNYVKSNCKWSTRSEQNMNKRTTSNTNVKHIHKRRCNQTYRIDVRPFGSRTAKTLEEAKEIREELLTLRSKNTEL